MADRIGREAWFIEVRTLRHEIASVCFKPYCCLITLLMNAERMNTTFFDKTFRDRNGDVVIVQPPNLPIIIWFVASLLKLLPTNDTIASGLDFLAFGALFVWAWQELFDGVNYFRRSIGFVVLFGLMASKIFSIRG